MQVYLFPEGKPGSSTGKQWFPQTAVSVSVPQVINKALELKSAVLFVFFFPNVIAIHWYLSLELKEETHAVIFTGGHSTQL